MLRYLLGNRKNDLFICGISVNMFNIKYRGNLKMSKKIDLTNAKPIKTKNGYFIAAEGELSGHSHKIKDDGGVAMMELENGDRILKVTKPSDLTHEEHHTQHFTDGVGYVEIQNEWSLDRARRAID